MTFRTRTFLGVFLSTSIAFGVATLLTERSVRTSMSADIRAGLLVQARLVGSLLARQAPAGDLDEAADAIGSLVGERVTFIASDGRVLGDSDIDRTAIATVENHATREEVRAALQAGEGTAVRLSQTTSVETIYAAVAVSAGPVAFVRVALPLTAVEQRVWRVRRLAVIGLGAGLAAALLVTWIASLLLNRRLRAVAETAERYKAGDFGRPARDHGRDEIGTVANVLDDTARQLGMRLGDIERERAHMDAILTGMVEGVVLVNSAGRLVLANPAVRSMLRLPEPAEGRHYLEVVRHPSIAAAVAGALEGHTSPSIEVPVERPRDQGRRTCVARVVPVARARGGGAVVVLHDITDLKQADQVRRDFVANVSHELRTPLTAIRGYVEALLDAPPPPEDTHRFLEIISRHALRMDRLVRDLLRLARLDAGQETVERVDCSAATLVTAVERDLETQLAQRRQRVTMDASDGAGSISGDPAKLQDVLRNLVENASNYSPEDAVIEVGTRRTEQGIELTVADRGPGIPEADLQRIFERFYRVDRSRTRDPGGTGLGLSIVRHLVGLHGGKVTATNRAGGGAVFTVTLPLDESRPS